MPISKIESEKSPAMFEDLSPKERSEEATKFFESFLDCQVLLGHIAIKQANMILSAVLQYGEACADIREGAVLRRPCG